MIFCIVGDNALVAGYLKASQGLMTIAFIVYVAAACVYFAWFSVLLPRLKHGPTAIGPAAVILCLVGSKDKHSQPYWTRLFFIVIVANIRTKTYFSCSEVIIVT